MSESKEKKELESANELATALGHVRQAEEAVLSVQRQSNDDRDDDLLERAAQLRAAHDEFAKALKS